MYDAHLNPKDVLHPTTVALETMQFIAPDPESTDLTHELIAWALEVAARASAAQRDPPEGKNA